MHALTLLLLFLGAVVSAELTDMDEEGVLGPESLTKREKRSLTNSHDCPQSWTRPIEPPFVPSIPCPPGQMRPPSFGGPPFQPYPRNRPCPPWVDGNGRCHIHDRNFDGTRCRRHFGEELYAQWQDNAYITQPVAPPGTPAPPCRPAGLPGGY